MEKYALTGLEPRPYSILENAYIECKAPSKARDARERGVASRDPESVVSFVKYVSASFSNALNTDSTVALALQRTAGHE
jgi:hypothetical protein